MKTLRIFLVLAVAAVTMAVIVALADSGIVVKPRGNAVKPQACATDCRCVKAGGTTIRPLKYEAPAGALTVGMQRRGA